MQEIINDVDSHLWKVVWSKYFKDFYIWITKDINDRLFNAHNVSKSWQWYIYRQAINDSHARAVEKHYLDKWMKWGWWGWDNTATYVYCYEIANFTNE